MNENDRLLVWLHGEVKSPPFSNLARHVAGFMLRRLQHRDQLHMPHSRPMSMIGPRCHELRVVDVGVTWRIVYRVDEDQILIADVFSKKTRATPRSVIKACRRHFQEHDDE